MHDLPVHGNLRIPHDGADLSRDLQGLFGPDDRAVLTRSSLVSSHPEWVGLVTYAAERPAYRLLCFDASRYELQVMVEPIGGSSLKKACGTVWTAIDKSARKNHGVRLESLTVVDDLTSEQIMSAQTGLRSNLMRMTLIPWLVTGLAYVVWLAVALPTFARDEVAATIQGAVPGFVLGILALSQAIRTRGNLVWSE